MIHVAADRAFQTGTNIYLKKKNEEGDSPDSQNREYSDHIFILRKHPSI